MVWSGTLCRNCVMNFNTDMSCKESRQRGTIRLAPRGPYRGRDMQLIEAMQTLQDLSYRHLVCSFEEVQREEDGEVEKDAFVMLMGTN